MGAIYSKSAIETALKSCEPARARLERTLQTLYKSDKPLDWFVKRSNSRWAEEPEQVPNPEAIRA